MALPETEEDLKKLRADTIKAIKAKGGKADAPGYTKRLQEIDTKLATVRGTKGAAPTPETPGAGQPIDNSAGGATTGVSTGNLPSGIPSELLEGLNLGKALYPDGSLGRLPNPNPIGPLGPWDKVEMVDQNGVPKVNVVDTSKLPKIGNIDPNTIKDVQGVTLSDIPQVKEITSAANDGTVKSISQWDEYSKKTQERDAYIDGALNRAMKMAEDGYSGQDMNAKRAKSNKVIDAQTQTALRDMRNSQGAAGNFGGVAAARQKNLMRDSLLNKAMSESDLLAGEADYKLNANTQAGTLANQAYNSYNTAQQAGLTGLTNARTSAADEILKREMSNQEAQGKNASTYLEGSSQNLTANIANQGKNTQIATANQDAEGKNASNWITGEQVRGQQEGTNASNTLSVLQGNQSAQGTNAQIQSNRDISNQSTQAGNLDREQNTTITNMTQNEKEKSLQSGTGIGYWQYLDAKTQQQLMNQIQAELVKQTQKGL